MDDMRHSGDREASTEGFARPKPLPRLRLQRMRLLAGALVVCTLAAAAGCSQSGDASGPAAEEDAMANSSVARDWASVEDGLGRELDDETRETLEEASRGDAGAQGSVAPDTIRAGSG